MFKYNYIKSKNYKNKTLVNYKSIRIYFSTNKDMNHMYGMYPKDDKIIKVIENAYI